jgi:hypothetical protein
MGFSRRFIFFTRATTTSPRGFFVMLFCRYYKFHALAGIVLLILTLDLIICQKTLADWVAGRDLALNEQPDGAQELINPNHMVPEWSYGFRTTIASSSLTLFPVGDHFNDRSGYADFDGWGAVSTNGATTLVNAGVNPIILNFGFGPLLPLDPLKIDMHPAANNDVAVVRWTSPAAGQYSIDASWTDIDLYGGDGASADIVVKGASIFHHEWANGGSAADARQLSLQLGDTIDFVVGPRGNFTFDSTAFDASITLVPEPSNIALAIFSGLIIVTRRSVWHNRRENFVCVDI